MEENWGKTDAPWWYNERASLSLFAGAVWVCGGWAFEEYATSKRSKIKKRKNRNGRGDLFFSIRKHGYVAEAKQYWSGMGKRARDPVVGIKNSLRKARKDSWDVPVDKKEIRLGLVFVVPWFPKSEQENVGKLIQRWLSRATKISGAAIAWTFPRAKRKLKADDGYIHPGVLLLARPLRLRIGK